MHPRRLSAVGFDFCFSAKRKEEMGSQVLRQTLAPWAVVSYLPAETGMYPPADVTPGRGQQVDKKHKWRHRMNVSRAKSITSDQRKM